ncbi:hypothetical protein Syun_003833 [Stephania yunnanensis]|uniref:Uncharacterized protein n=1 Tax=Stephania yunnanensis TaxID=152371 RepID=A0AAP0L269_9MAGN
MVIFVVVVLALLAPLLRSPRASTSSSFTPLLILAFLLPCRPTSPSLFYSFFCITPLPLSSKRLCIVMFLTITPLLPGSPLASASSCSSPSRLCSMVILSLLHSQVALLCSLVVLLCSLIVFAFLRHAQLDETSKGKDDELEESFT